MNENTTSARRVGLTPLLARLAWYYAKKGEGQYYIDHKEYDNVVVSQRYDWTVVDGVGQGCLEVSFRLGREKIRSIELGVHIVGARGEPLVRET